MNFKAIALAGALCAGLAACGGDDTIPQTRTLSAGESLTIGPNQTFYVPSNTTVDSSGTHVTITGHNNTINALVGSVRRSGRSICGHRRVAVRE